MGAAGRRRPGRRDGPRQGCSRAGSATRLLLPLTPAVAIGTAVAAPLLSHSLPALTPLLLTGIVVMWLGVALRARALATFAEASPRPSKARLAGGVSRRASTGQFAIRRTPGCC